jgi:molybdopterin-guanine dinucleotide biosynthesis protein A
MKRGGIILCGGKSTRMGLPKATLPLGDELMLQCVVRLLGEAVEQIVVVAAPEQDVPTLPSEVLLVRDHREGRGPLEGLSAGLEALDGQVDAAYITGCDVPLLVPAFVSRLFQLLGEHQIAVPYVDGYHQSLSAVYRTDVLHTVRELLAADRMRPFFLFESVSTLVVEENELREVDPTLNTLRNLNQKEDYLAVLDELGLDLPETVKRKLR